MKKLLLYNLIGDNELFYFYRKRNLSLTGIHFQDFYEFTILLKGSTHHLINGKSYPIERGDVLFIHKNSTHGIGNGTENNPIEFINIGFNENIFSLTCKLLNINNSSELQSRIKISDSFLSILYDKFNTINFYTNKAQSECNAKLLIMMIMNEFKFSKSNQYSNLPMWLLKIIEEINTIENIKLGVSKIYEISPYSKQHTINKFKEYLNTLPSDYINFKKIDYACNLLANTDMDIIDISLECGYNNLEYFYRKFKNYKGLTPSIYRKTNHNILMFK